MSNNDNDEWKTGAEGIARLEKTKWGKVRKPRRIKKIAESLRRTVEKKLEERKERKEIYKKAFKKAEKGAIISRARREAREKYAPRPRRDRARIAAGLFDLPSGISDVSLFPKPTARPAKPRKRRAKRKAPRKATRQRTRPRKVVYY